jgi:hypothetical protein
MRMLTASEETDFETIVREAKRSGWLAHEARLHVIRIDRLVRVSGRSGETHFECSYDDSDRWAFEFLRDLAHGAARPRQR